MATQTVQRPLTPEQLDHQINLLDSAVKEYAIADTFTQAGSLSQTLKLARGMGALRGLLTEQVVKELLVPLQDSPLGFLTDCPPGPNWKGEMVEPYGWETVRDVAIEAFIRGLQPVGNEFNILAKRCYATKNGIARKLREHPKLTNLAARPGLVTLSNDGSSAAVVFRIDYLLDGAPRCLERDVLRGGADGKTVLSDQRIQVRVNKGMGFDAILGKAHRKAMALLLDHLTGSTLSLPTADIGDDEAIPTTAEPSPAQPAGEPAKSAQGQQLADVLKKHAPQTTNNSGPSPEEAAADERANSSK